MNRLLTAEEVNKEITEPLLKVIEDDLKLRPIKKGEKRIYPNPLSDCMPIEVIG